MAENSDRLLGEARQLIDSGNKTVTLFLLASIIWWVANLFPHNLSESNSVSIQGRLYRLSDLATRAERACSSTVDNFVNHRHPSLLFDAPSPKVTNCFVKETEFSFTPADRAELQGGPLRALSVIESRPVAVRYIEEIKRRKLKRAITVIDDELNKLGEHDGCRDVIDEWRKQYFNACITKENKLTEFTKEWSKEGSFDVAGLKISNIHPKWHPLVLLVLLSAGAVWLGNKRRRIFVLLDASFYDFEVTHKTGTKFNNGESEVKSTDSRSKDADSTKVMPALLSLPWWLRPLPNWQYPSGATFQTYIAPKSEFRRSPITLFFVLSILGAMFFSGIQSQMTFSEFAMSFPMSPNQRDLADFAGESLSLTRRGVLPDLFIVAFLFFASIATFCWIALPPRISHQVSERGFYRREVVVRTASFLAAVSILSIVTPIATHPQSLEKLAQRLRILNKPRFRERKKRFAVHPGPPGWYRNDQPEGKSLASWIGHFVKPELNFHRKAKRGPKRLDKPIQHEAGRIRGAGKLRIERLHLLDDNDLPKWSSSFVVSETNVRPRRPQLNYNFYSEGIEYIALKRWTDGNKDLAIQILQVGLTYAGPHKSIRLYDLLAGFLVRLGRESEIIELRTNVEAIRKAVGERRRYLVQDGSAKVDYVGAKRGKIKKRKALARRGKQSENLIAKLDSRLSRWNDENGKWRQKWRSSARHTWNGVDI